MVDKHLVLNNCETNDIPIILSCTLSLTPIMKCWHANTLQQLI